MTKNDSRYYLKLPYPENLIRTVCTDEEEITEDRILGLQHCLERMTERQLEVLEARFQERKTFREIADQYGLATERICGIYEKSMRKLRHPSRFDLIAFGYNTAAEERKKAAEAEKRNNEAAFKKAMEEIGNPELLTMQISELNLPVRIVNGLTWAGIETVMDLWIISQRYTKQYERIRNIGEGSRNEIQKQMKKLGFDL